MYDYPAGHGVEFLLGQLVRGLDIRPGFGLSILQLVCHAFPPYADERYCSFLQLDYPFSADRPSSAAAFPIASTRRLNCCIAQGPSPGAATAATRDQTSALYSVAALTMVQL